MFVFFCTSTSFSNQHSNQYILNHFFNFFFSSSIYNQQSINNQYNQHHTAIEKETEEIVKKNESLRKELKDLTTAATSLPTLDEKYHMYQDDLLKFDEHLMKMNKVKEAHSIRTKTNQKKLKTKREKLEKVETIRSNLREQLRTQDLSAQDVERISQDRLRLKTEMNSAEEVKEQVSFSKYSKFKILKKCKFCVTIY